MGKAELCGKQLWGPYIYRCKWTTLQLNRAGNSLVLTDGYCSKLRVIYAMWIWRPRWNHITVPSIMTRYRSSVPGNNVRCQGLRSVERMLVVLLLHMTKMMIQNVSCELGYLLHRPSSVIPIDEEFHPTTFLESTQRNITWMSEIAQEN